MAIEAAVAWRTAPNTGWRALLDRCDIAFLGWGWRAPPDTRVFILITAFLGEHFSLLQYSWVCRQINRPALWCRYSIAKAWESWHQYLDQRWPVTIHCSIRYRIPIVNGVETNIYRVTFWQDRLGIPSEDQVEAMFYDAVHRWIWNYEPWRLLDPDDADALFGAAGFSP